MEENERRAVEREERERILRGGKVGRSKTAPPRKSDQERFYAPLEKFYEKETTKKNMWQAGTYLDVFKKSKDMTKDYEIVQASVSPSNCLLRTRLMQMSNSPEVFHSLRRQTTPHL